MRFAAPSPRPEPPDEVQTLTRVFVCLAASVGTVTVLWVGWQIIKRRMGL